MQSAKIIYGPTLQGRIPVRQVIYEASFQAFKIFGVTGMNNLL